VELFPGGKTAFFRSEKSQAVFAVLPAVPGAEKQEFTLKAAPRRTGKAKNPQICKAFYLYISADLLCCVFSCFSSSVEHYAADFRDFVKLFCFTKL